LEDGFDVYKMEVGYAIKNQFGNIETISHIDKFFNLRV